MTVAVEEILRQAEPLSADEQLTLAVLLIEQARIKITRAHREGDDERERMWKAAQEVFERVSWPRKGSDERERMDDAYFK